MRIAIVSDIHGNLPALEAVIADVRRRGADRVVNLGDTLSGPLMPRETAQYVMSEGWLSLAGNHERQLLSFDAGSANASDTYAHSQLSSGELEWMRGLPKTAALGPEVFLCHGTPASDLEYFLETADPTGIRPATSVEIDARLGPVRAGLIVCGHSHMAHCVRAPGGPVIVNPGSVGLQAYAAKLPHAHAVQTRSPDARYAIAERRGTGWIVSLLCVPYDHERMAALAAERGRHDWAHALETGYVR